ncbi:glycosyltransferase family 2 protein [Microseira wollei]|uniref:Glycosyl transferase family protein n=1 Tax=Microseira wollei NIES-4236 TaxID=2530354 RepID=A0AAV3X4J7_9CYAN|nr:glycosyltransferase family 2 protein [Microseira wollei]GET36106.1 glycosyl transferase family protein [Microseira wollei NIES-4236]
MTQMKFSIVITTYNRLSFLKRAIESALAQTVPCEVVVVDDCSSDDTQDYVRSLGSRVTYHRNLTNMGHAAAVNAGVQVAQGDWIKPVDDDDYLDPNCIKEMMRAIALRREAVICSCQAAQVDVNQVEINRTRKMGPGQAFYIPQEDIHYGMLLEQIPFGTPIQVAFRRDAFIQSGGWDSSLDANFDDIDSWLRIAQFGDAIFINKCLAYRTVWPGGYNQKFSLQKRLETNILIKEKIHALVSENHRALIPEIGAIRAYVKLHWSLVALKQKAYLTSMKFVFPALLSRQAWQLLIEAIIFRYKQPPWLQKNLDSNLLVMAKMYAITNEKHRAALPNLQHFQSYMKLRSSWVACKQGKLLTAVQLALPSLSSPAAWKLVIKSALSEPEKNKRIPIRKFVLIDF